ncbi:hypothetical protein CPC08DRAFT_789542 [Agrocybe pediades]|nr:hypothetical protein CPC08DRAFT_789542 [Agrocybe pediades]
MPISRKMFDNFRQFFLPSSLGDIAAGNYEDHSLLIETEDTRHSARTVVVQDSPGVGRYPLAIPSISKSDGEQKSGQSKMAEAAMPHLEGRSSLHREAGGRKRTKDTISELTSNLDHENDMRRKLAKDLDDALQKIEGLDKAVRMRERERDDAIRHWHELQQQISHREMQLYSMDAKAKRQQEEIGMLNERLKGAEERRIEMSKLLDERTNDLKGVETFITTADLYSGADVVKMVDSLNAEIFQTAALVSEFLEDTSLGANPEEYKRGVEQYKDPLRITHNQIGADLFLHLQNKREGVQDDPLPLQLALQGVITAWCVWKTQSFRQTRSDIDELYGRIRGSEIQSITGRWRAITYAHCHDPETTRKDAQLLRDCVLGLLVLCGWSTKSATHIQRVQSMLDGVEKLQSQLKLAIKEGITTTELDVFHVISQSGFSDKEMEEEYSEDTRNEARTKVLVAVGLGLKKTTIKVDDRGQKRILTDILSKSKVALTSVLT